MPTINKTTVIGAVATLGGLFIYKKFISSKVSSLLGVSVSNG